MEIVKVCMDCGNEFEDNIIFDDTLICPNCGSGDVHQPTEIDYDELTIEDCFVIYHTDKIACVCNADTKEIRFMEE